MALRHVLPLLTFAALSTATPEIVIATVLEGFPWSDPFQGADSPAGFLATCTASRTFHATQHIVRDLKEPLPLGLEPWSKAIPYFFGGRPYPGSWEGVDHKGEGREIVKMEWMDLPPAARDWVRAKQNSAEDEKYLFAVYEKEGEGGEPVKGIRKLGEGGEGEEDLVVLFAAAALYHIMPLLVADGGECEAELLDLENYGGTPEDQKVVAWPVERTDPDWNNGGVDIEFTIKAQVLSETEEGRAERVKREEEAKAREEEEAREREEEEARLREEEEQEQARIREEEQAGAGEEEREGEEKGVDGGDGSAEGGSGSGEAAESTVSEAGKVDQTGDQEVKEKEKEKDEKDEL
ncbi:uncharacterized protein DNG_10050 [Cephalotrichum gorgonifer]|uniref:Uncharacterized protein n=1 Tax=Cephalotrichum gorgonifer TaxID=2041049 RepID=A0AAE8N6W0_9PEZI|nr:uncharacterized protein DNG_10050 [Cephalotrichum gorgonifer]